MTDIRGLSGTHHQYLVQETHCASVVINQCCLVAIVRTQQERFISIPPTSLKNVLITAKFKMMGSFQSSEVKGSAFRTQKANIPPSMPKHGLDNNGNVKKVTHRAAYREDSQSDFDHANVRSSNSYAEVAGDEHEAHVCESECIVATGLARETRALTTSK